MNQYLAKGLLHTQSIQIQPGNPFKLSSGRMSPVYVDCRRLISFTDLRSQIIECFAQIVHEHIGLSRIDIIAGGETAGIPYAAFLALRLNKPMIYVRKELKGYGKSSQVEGVLSPGQTVALVEDLVTDGESKLSFKKGIEQSGGFVQHCLCVFEYFSEEAQLQRARETLRQNGIELHALVNWDDLLSIARAEKSLTTQEIGAILKFLRGLAS